MQGTKDHAPDHQSHRLIHRIEPERRHNNLALGYDREHVAEKAAEQEAPDDRTNAADKQHARHPAHFTFGFLDEGEITRQAGQDQTIADIAEHHAEKQEEERRQERRRVDVFTGWGTEHLDDHFKGLDDLGIIELDRWLLARLGRAGLGGDQEAGLERPDRFSRQTGWNPAGQVEGAGCAGQAAEGIDFVALQ